MILALYDQYDIAKLWFCSFFSGFFLLFIYIFLVIVPGIIASVRYIKDGYQTFAGQVCAKLNNMTVLGLSDFLICLCAACLLCILSFIFNSGQFRLSSLALLIVGFSIGKLLCKRIVERSFLLASYAVLKVVRVALYPFAVLLKRLFGTVAALTKKASYRRKKSIIIKYTESRFRELEKQTRFGGIDKYYKEMIK